MHVLTVLDHPDPNSFSAALAQSFIEGCKIAGHSTECADLHAEGFDPRWTVADAQGTPQPNIVAEQDRIARADAICFLFPLFWWGMPAMSKGWLERVWAWKWAYDQLDDPEKSLQRPRSGLLLVPAGAREDEVVQNGYRAALDRIWLDGTFGYFGFSPRRLELLCGAEGSAKRREGLLTRAHELGRTLPTPAQKS